MVEESMDAFEEPQTDEDVLVDAGGPEPQARLPFRSIGAIPPFRRAPAAATRGIRKAAEEAAPGGRTAAAEEVTPGSRTAAAEEVAPGSRTAAAIEAALLPRLVMMHGGRSPVAPERADATIADTLESFTASLLVDDDAMSSMALLRHCSAGGAGFETLCLQMLAPAARRLGTLWEEDDCDFALLTLGLSRLHRLLHGLDAQFAAAAVPVDPHRVAMLAVSPGEQHVFGLAMVGEFLRRAGWEVCDAVGSSQRELVETVRGSWFAVAAMSCSGERGLSGLAATVAAMRAQARNRRLAVLVGGRIFNDQPAAAIRVGADATAGDARAAVWQAERLLAQAQVREPAS